MAEDPRLTDTARLTARLRSEILSGAVAPGSKLKLEPLARRYASSRGPLREAASRLAAEGLVRIHDRRGFQVAPISRVDLLTLTETRRRIEVWALRDSIAQGDLAWEGRVLASHHVLEGSTEHDGSEPALRHYAEEHRRFHDVLVSACPSPYLLEFRERLFALSERYRNLARARRPGGPRRDVAGEHRAIAEAAVARDADRAADALATHLEGTARVLIDAYPALFGAE